MKKYACLLFIISVLFTACGSGISTDKLEGKWKYLKVENPNANPPTFVSDIILNAQKPYAEFSAGNQMTIYWDGKALSHGTYTLDGSNIHFKEEWAKGQFREFPFFISKFDGKNMVFETLGKEGTRVTAVKE